jgi:outer membrane protein TolC
VDYLSFLDAQRVEFNAEESLILVDFSILDNRVALHRSLGGGWAHTDNPEMLSADQ